MIFDLSTILQRHTNLELQAIMDDARRYILVNSHVADITPLQLYFSGIVFSPWHSIVRKYSVIPVWLSKVPVVSDQWDLVLQIFET